MASAAAKLKALKAADPLKFLNLLRVRLERVSAVSVQTAKKGAGQGGIRYNTTRFVLN